MLDRFFKVEKKAKSTPLSKFVNETPLSEKKRVYRDVLERATAAQKKILASAKVAS